MKKGLYIGLIFTLITVAVITGCAKIPEAAPAPELTPTATPLPSADKISESPITFIFNQSETSDYNSLYHQLAYIKLESQGYNISNLYITEDQDIERALADIESQGTEYVVLTGVYFNDIAQQYNENNDSQMVFLQYGDYDAANIISYKVKLYEYYYLAGAALCSQSANKIAGFVASNPDEQTIRCINAFALGMKSIDKDAAVIINWIDSASDQTMINQSISDLQSQNCDVLAYFIQTDVVENAAASSGLYYMSMSTHAQLNENDKLIIKPVINLDTYFASVVNTSPDSLLYEFNYLGADNHVLSYELSSYAPQQTEAALNSAYTNIQSGYEVFSGPIYNKLGLIVPEGTQLPQSDILDMLWFVDNVIGELPAG